PAAAYRFPGQTPASPATRPRLALGRRSGLAHGGRATPVSEDRELFVLMPGPPCSGLPTVSGPSPQDDPAASPNVLGNPALGDLLRSTSTGSAGPGGVPRSAFTGGEYDRTRDRPVAHGRPAPDRLHQLLLPQLRGGCEPRRGDRHHRRDRLRG